MVREIRAVERIADAVLDAAKRCREKALAVMTDERFTPEERLEVKAGFERLAIDQEEAAKRWRNG